MLLLLNALKKAWEAVDIIVLTRCEKISEQRTLLPKNQLLIVLILSHLLVPRKMGIFPFDSLLSSPQKKTSPRHILIRNYFH